MAIRRWRLWFVLALALALPVAVAQGHSQSGGSPLSTGSSTTTADSALSYTPARPAADLNPPPVGTVAATQGRNARYALANGCYSLRSRSLGRLVAKSGGGYRASASDPGQAEPFRMQATALGSYLFYGPKADFLASASGGKVVTAAGASPAADWTVDVEAGAFKVSMPAAGKVLAVAPGSGDLVLADSASAGSSALFTFERAGGCAVYPEVETSAVGTPATGSTPFTETSGLVDAHMHMMAFEFLGGRAHCGRPWHRYGAPYALVDCPDHYPNGAAAVLETGVSGGSPTHDPVGWPTFKDWPRHDSLTHEQSYYRWLERAWLGGQRVFVNLFVENKVLCEIYPYKQNSCDEMNSVRLQHKRIYELQDYIDAQNGGPSKGWFRIVTDPYQARRVINAGKLAVVLGIEVSEPFGCQVYNDQPKCDAAQIDRGLDEVYKLGVRDMELINKFDNALAGVAGDEGSTGAVVNSGNKLETGKYWQMQACSGPEDEVDKEQPGVYDHDDDDLITNGLETLLPPGLAPVYPKGSSCNARGLTALGEHLIRRMIAKGMVVDPDHLGVLSRKGVMALLEAARYSGVVSSHSWSSPDVVPRIYKLGGLVTPYAGDSTGFVAAWRKTRPQRGKRFGFGFGFGADMNGFGAQGGPRKGANPVTYPFKSPDGKVTLSRQRSGSRVYDINEDGVAHYGLYPDWIQDLRKIAGSQIIGDMTRGSEAYLQMWERANGVPAERCRSARGRFTRRGMGRHRLGVTADQLLRRAGQPLRRKGRTFRYCVQGRGNRGAKLVAVMTAGGRVGLLASNARGHGTIDPGKFRISRGAGVRRLHGRAKRFGRGKFIRSAGRGVRFIYGVRRGRVRYVAVASRSVAKSPRRLRAYLRLSGVR